ncbi:MAG: hypothetical protein E7376_01610 [Clostridiales bacterium]|nr:hypothetical protein [Clostridiales bacterium]
MDTDLIVVNLKEDMPPVEIALCNMELEIELAKVSGIKAIKFIHGYGSSGVGGSICKAVRERLVSLKKQRIIKEYIFGEDWNLDNPKCFKLLTSLKSGYDGEDLNNANAGMTIVFVK